MQALTKTALRAEKAIRIVAAALREHRDAFGAGLDERFRAHVGAGEAMPEHSLVAELMARCLEATGRTLLAADLAKLDESAVDTVLRSKRDATALELYHELVALKGTVRHVYGREGVRALGFARRLEEDPVVVQRQTERLLGNLGDPERPLPAPRVASLAIDPEAVRRSLAPKVAALRDVLRRLDAEQRETETAQLAKNAAVASYKRDVVQITRAAVALFRLIGRDDVADHLQPLASRSVRRGRESRLPVVAR